MLTSGEAGSRQGRGIPARKPSAPTAASQTLLSRVSTRLGTVNREAVWPKDFAKGGQLESRWLVWWDDHKRSDAV